MNTSEFSKKTVKVISQKIELNWIHPYKNKDTRRSIGSGFFIDDKGHIITCSHVIQDSKKIYIEIPDEGDKKIEVRVLGLCPEFDIALLQTIDYVNTEYYELHSRQEIYSIKPGCEVYAIGFPLGQDNLKFTKGIISGRQDSLIQTDTPINPGNSGGPLLLNGKVIGINTSIILFTNNIGYATPISFYYIIQKELFENKNNKLIMRPHVGIHYQNSNEALLEVNKCKCSGGILVKEIFKGSPISKCGIKKGDIICSVNDIKVDNFGLFDFQWFNERMRLTDILKTIKKDEMISLEFWRGKKLHQKKFKFTIFNLPIEKKYPLFEPVAIDYEVFGGMIFMELSDNHLEIILDDLESDFSRNKKLNRKFTNLMQYLSPENKRKSRVIITHIFPNSYVKNFDIISDYDILDTVNHKKVDNLTDLRKYIKLTKKIGKKEYLTFDTEINNSIVLAIDKLIQEEKVFSDTYKYNISSLFNHFAKGNRKQISFNNKKKNNKNKKKVSLKKKKTNSKKKRALTKKK
jgi:serine protease Do